MTREFSHLRQRSRPDIMRIAGTILLAIGIMVTSGSAIAQFIGIPITLTRAAAAKSWTRELSHDVNNRFVTACDPNKSNACAGLSTSLASGVPGAFPQIHHVVGADAHGDDGRPPVGLQRKQTSNL